jgi:hypothetical protein
VTLTVLLLQVASSQAAPHHLPQQQLLYYNHVIPPQQRQSANIIAIPGNSAGYVLAFDIPASSEASIDLLGCNGVWTFS